MREIEHYRPDRRLGRAYHEANLLDEEGLAAICPSYIELAETEMRYREDSLLGSGSLKDVYRCWDCRGRRWVAMAKLRPDRGSEFYDLFVNEAWISSSLNHPNIIKIHDVGLDSTGHPFFTMDLKGENTLATLLEQKNSEPSQLLGIFLKVCDAVAYAHEKGILHLDLKPENIQAESFGEVLVCDWGLAKKIDDPDPATEDIPFPAQTESVGNVTLFGEVKGSLGYMAPEQVQSGEEKSERTDVFALGCLLHAILTGESPITGNSQRELLGKTARAQFPPPRSKFPQIPESLEAVILKACKAKPDDRYQSVLNLAQDVRKYLHGFATEAEEPGFLRASSLFLRRHRLPAAISFIAIVTLTICAVLFAQRINHQRTRADNLAMAVNRYGEAEVQVAAQLADSAATLKNLGVFKTPSKSISAAHQLATLALQLDPNNENANYQVFALSLIQLNFQSALAHPPGPEHPYSDYLGLAHSFPDFAYNGRSRPTPEVLANFFREAREITPGRGALMERILSYHYSIGRSPEPEPIVALLEYLNDGPDHLQCEFRADRLSIWSDQDIKLRLPIGSGSGRCLLRYYPFSHLDLRVEGAVDLTGLHSLNIKTLDLRGSNQLVLRNAVALPLLKEVYVRPEQMEPTELARLFRTIEPIEIIVSSEENPVFSKN